MPIPRARRTIHRLFERRATRGGVCLGRRFRLCLGNRDDGERRLGGDGGRLCRRRARRRGIPNLVAHGKTGFLFRPSDTKDAVQWTCGLLTDIGLRTQMGAAARQAIEERNWEHSIGRYDRLIYKPSSNRTARPSGPD